jgi:opacity protein-like surface antigen
MKQTVMWLVAILVLSLLLVPAAIRAEHPRSAGIGLRTSYWDMAGVDNRIVAHSYDGDEWIDVGGTGGHFYLLSRISERMMLELNFGSTGSVKGVERWYGDQDYDVTAVIPITLGLRYDLLALHNPGVARPYLSAGAGPYIVAKASVHEDWFGDEVVGEWDAHRGAYLGAGLDYRLTSWLWLNFDARHHFVDMDADNEFSGFEYGIGLQFMWGRYGR